MLEVLTFSRFPQWVTWFPYKSIISNSIFYESLWKWREIKTHRISGQTYLNLTVSSLKKLFSRLTKWQVHNLILLNYYLLQITIDETLKLLGLIKNDTRMIFFFLLLICTLFGFGSLYIIIWGGCLVRVKHDEKNNVSLTLSTSL